MAVSVMKDLLKVSGLLVAYVLIRAILAILGRVVYSTANEIQALELQIHLGRNAGDEAQSDKEWLEGIHGTSRAVFDSIQTCRVRLERFIRPQPLVVR